MCVCVSVGLVYSKMFIFYIPFSFQVHVVPIYSSAETILVFISHLSATEMTTVITDGTNSSVRRVLWVRSV